jgi:excisionase family DNA binding protein
MSDLLVIDASPEQRSAIRGINAALMEPQQQQPKIAFLVSPDGQSKIQLPEPLYRVLLQAAATLISGYQVVMAPVQHLLTTQEAADLLNVSRPYLVRLLDRGDMPSEKVGRHRRVTFGALMDYKKGRVDERRQALENLIRESEELGLYDRTDPAEPGNA